MKVLEALFYPYSQAQAHFKQAAHSEWKNWTVHYVVGALECIPIINYLVVLVDLAVKALFKKAPEVPARPTPKIELRTLNFDTFVERFGISFETPLQLELKEIQENQNLWTEDRENMVWGRRVRVIRETINELLQFIDNDSLKNLQKDKNKDPYELYQELKGIIEHK